MNSTNEAGKLPGSIASNFDKKKAPGLNNASTRRLCLRDDAEAPSHLLNDRHSAAIL
jgi:hypothetical protein